MAAKSLLVTKASIAMRYHQITQQLRTVILLGGAFVSLLLMGACAGTLHPSAVVNTADEGISCLPKRSATQPPGRYFDASASGPISEAALKRAYANALATGLSELQVTIDSEMTSEEVARGESYTETLVLKTKASTTKVKVKGARIANECVTPSGATVYVRVFIPAQEWARLARLANDETGLLITCRAGLEGGCTQEMQRRIGAAVSDPSLRLKRVILPDGISTASPDVIEQIGQEEGLAKLLVVDVSFSPLTPYRDDADYEVSRVSAQAELSLFDAIEMSTIRQVQVGSTPGAGVGELIGHAYSDDPPVAPYAEALQYLVDGQGDIEGLKAVWRTWREALSRP